MKKTLSWLIVLALLVGMMPAVFATEGELVEGDNFIELAIDAEEASVYNFVATQTGTLYVVVHDWYYISSWSEGSNDNLEDLAYETEFLVNDGMLEGGYYGSIEVVEGETYTISWDHIFGIDDRWASFTAYVNLSYTDEMMPILGRDFPLCLEHLPMDYPEIPAGEMMECNIGYEFEGYIVTVEGEGAYIMVRYQTDWWSGEFEEAYIYDEDDGVVDGVVEYNFVQYNYSTVFYIGNAGDEAAVFEVDYYAPAGSTHNPILVESLDEVAVEKAAETEGFLCFKWIATERGTINVDLTTHPDDNPYVSFENLTTGEYGEYGDGYETYSIYVEEGDELMIAVGGYFWVDTYYQLPYEFIPGARLGSEENPIVVDLLEGMDVNLYNKTLYYSWTPDFTGTVTLDFELLYTWSDNVPTITIGGEEYTLSTELAVTAGEPVIMCMSTVNSVYGTLMANIVFIEEEPTYFEIADGEYVISWGELTFGALKETYNYGYAPAGDINALQITDYFTITNVGEGQFTIQDCYGRYVYMTGTFNSFNVSAEAPAEGHLWVLEETEGGLLLMNVLKEKYVAYSEKYGTWGCYSSTSETSVLTFTAAETAPTGDANGDGEIDYLDAMLIAQFYVGDITAEDLDVAAADVTGDGNVDYLDAMLVAQYYVGDIDSFEN